MRFFLPKLRDSKGCALRQQRAWYVFGLSEWARNRLTRNKHHLAVSFRPTNYSCPSERSEESKG